MKEEIFFLFEKIIKLANNMRKLIIVTLIILSSGLSAMSQLFTYGVQCGLNYSHYSLSESNYLIQVKKGSIGFHSGFFVRNDFETFFIGADLNYSSTLGGTIDDTNSSFNIRSGSVNLPLLLGKKFYPGIRIFVGGSPNVYIKDNKNELQTFLENSPFAQPQINGILNHNEFVFNILVGAGIEISKFFIEFRYEHPLDYFIIEDFSTGGILSNIDNYHYLSQLVFTLGYQFN